MRFLKHAKVPDISLRTTVSYESVKFFVIKFHTLLNNEEVERIKTKFENFNEISYVRIDDNWHQISQIRNSSKQKKYIAFRNLILSILFIPTAMLLSKEHY